MKTKNTKKKNRFGTKLKVGDLVCVTKAGVIFLYRDHRGWLNRRYVLKGPAWASDDHILPEIVGIITQIMWRGPYMLSLSLWDIERQTEGWFEQPFTETDMASVRFVA